MESRSADTAQDVDAVRRVERLLPEVTFRQWGERG